MSRFASFREFYQFYLSEHRHPVSRRLHFIGSCGVLLLVAAAILRGQAILVLAALFCGYGFAWVGHFFFEKNRPATRSEEHTSELQSQSNLVCRLLLEKKKNKYN